jgi:hypothetical protein
VRKNFDLFKELHAHFGDPLKIVSFFFRIAPFCTNGDVIFSAVGPFFPKSGEGCTPVRELHPAGLDYI